MLISMGMTFLFMTMISSLLWPVLTLTFLPAVDTDSQMINWDIKIIILRNGRVFLSFVWMVQLLYFLNSIVHNSFSLKDN